MSDYRRAMQTQEPRPVAIQIIDEVVENVKIGTSIQDAALRKRMTRSPKL
jgi:hypothetical protein